MVAACRTRSIDLNSLISARKCMKFRMYSGGRVCFTVNGYTPTSDRQPPKSIQFNYSHHRSLNRQMENVPMNSKSSATISKFPFGAIPIFPAAITDEANPIIGISFRFSCDMITGIFWWLEPSLTSQMKNVFIFRSFRTHPCNETE